jgi:hypothetical protein
MVVLELLDNFFCLFNVGRLDPGVLELPYPTTERGGESDWRGKRSRWPWVLNPWPYEGYVECNLVV